MRICEVLRQYRWATKQEGRAFAKEIGIGASTLSRIEHGKMPDAANLALILRWPLGEEEDGESKA